MATKAKNEPKKRGRPKKDAEPRQGFLPDGEGGTLAPPSSPDIDRVADAFVEARDSWQAQGTVMRERKAIVKALMVKHGFKRYEYDGKEVVMDDEPDVHVRTKKKDGEEE